MSASDNRRSEDRKYRRAPVSVKVRYRSRGSFLISYSLNLSRGGLFLETTEPLSAGTTLTVHFSVTGFEWPAPTTARVVWTRDEADCGGGPPGVGLAFDKLESEVGALIDKLVADYCKVTLVALAAEDSTRTRLSRFLCNVLTCDVIEMTPESLHKSGLPEATELALIDVDSLGEPGLVALGALRGKHPYLPLIALCSDPKSEQVARGRGATAVLENPPAFDLLRRKVLETLARPIKPTFGDE